MKAMLFVLCLNLVSFGISSGAALTIAPSEAVLLPDDGSGGARIAMKFDLSGVSWSAGHQIVTANVDWSVAGLDEDAPAAFNVTSITQTWNSEALQSGLSPIQCATEASDDWVIDALGYERVGGFLRFRIPDLVRDWLENASSNHGILVRFENGAPSDLGSQLANARLVIHYVVVPAEQ